jgi:hypothetical protein
MASDCCEKVDISVTNNPVIPDEVQRELHPRIRNPAQVSFCFIDCRRL